MAIDKQPDEREKTVLTTVKFRVVEAPMGPGQPRKAIVRHPGSVCILPILDDGRICLINNYRVSVQQTLIELPAGTMEPPEPAEACARRELAEETGFVARKWTKLGELYLAPGLLDEKAHIFLAEELTPGDQRLEADEQIDNRIVDSEELERLLSAAEIQDAKTLATLDLWRRHIRSKS